MFISPPIPDVGRGEYLRDAFLALGMERDGPLPWSEIAGFSAMTGEITEPWEAHLVRSMSVDYLSGKAMTDPLAIPPFEG